MSVGPLNFTVPSISSGVSRDPAMISSPLTICKTSYNLGGYRRRSYYLSYPANSKSSIIAQCKHLRL